MEKKIFINTFYQMAGKVTTSLLGVVSFAFLARYLQGQLGEYALISSFVGFIVVFADFGLGTLLTREIASKKADDNYISHVFSLRFLLSLVSFIVGSLAIFIFPYSGNVKVGVAVLSFANIAYLMESVIWAVLQAKIQFGKIVITQIAASFVTCVLTIAGVFLNFPILYFIISSGVGLIVGFIISYFLLEKKIKFKINFSSYIKIIKEAWPLGAGVIVSVIYFKIDSLILPYFYNPSTHPDLAYYSTAYKIFEVAMVFAGYFTTTLFPVVSAEINTPKFKKSFYKYLFFTLILAVGANLFLFVFSKFLVLIIGGGTFLPAVKSLQVLSFAAFASILAGYFLSVGVAGKKQLWLFNCGLLAAIINIVLSVAFIPKYSFIGASYITLFTQFLILIMYVFIALPIIKLRKDEQNK